MGTVYGGTDRKSGGPVAVKVLAGRLSGEESFRQRFAKEIEALRQLNHPNIIQLLGYGQDDDTFFYSMELVDGCSLEEEIHRNKRRFTWQEALVTGLQITSALRCAHDHGVIHRDLKPGNLLLSTTGVVKLSDFGIASLFGSTRLTDVGNVIGTIEYMSPEQATQQPVTPRSDLYSLGAVLSALMSGRPPFLGKNLLEIVHQHSTQQAKRPSQLGVRLPLDFDLLVGQLLNRDPEKRPKSALLVYRQLEAILRNAVSEQESPGDAAAADENPQMGLPAETSAELPSLKNAEKSRPEDFVGESSIWCKQFPQTPAEPQMQEDTAQLARQCSALLGAAKSLAEESRTIRYVPERESLEELGEIAEGEHDVGEKTVTHFFEVEKEEHSSQNSSLDRFSESPWAGLILILISSVCFILMAFYLVRWWLSPPPADVLYERIVQAAKEDSLADAALLRTDVKNFVRYYSQDENIREVREIESRQELDQLERRLRSGARGRDFSAVAPVERDYQNAIYDIRFRPEESLGKLEAFVTYYRSVFAHLPSGEGDDAAQERLRKKNKKQVRQYVELAQRQILRVKGELARETEEQSVELEQQVKIALECLESEIEETREYGEDLRASILRLYGENAWAKSCLSPLLGGESGEVVTIMPEESQAE